MGEQRERMADIARASAGGSRSGASGTPGKDETSQSQDRQARAAMQAGTPAADMAGPAESDGRARRASGIPIMAHLAGA